MHGARICGFPKPSDGAQSPGCTRDAANVDAGVLLSGARDAVQTIEFGAQRQYSKVISHTRACRQRSLKIF